MPIHCVIVAPDKTVYSGNADIVVLPAVQGQIGVMGNHRPLFTELEAGLITVRNGENEEVFTILSGFVEVTNKEVRVLAEEAESVNDIDLEHAELAKRRAEDALKNLPKTESKEALVWMARVKMSKLRVRAVKRNQRRK